ncbi:acyltransferase family protein [Neorhizobium sp. NPDC001467]|uniref:acyltransferase family protein n=1 Tax=Neorhizobium sp. NPDC001467 TaxID=3390595 RepID=UPI003D021E78
MHTITSPNHFSYRADLDGLRAVAVLSVLLYHAGISWVPGGFVGVDVFLVLSGFFMAKIIMRDLERGSFSFVEFYGRRAKRIFPALFVMIFATTILATLLFMPAEYEYFAKSVRASALFYSNILFLDESGYFDIGSKMKPLLHTWSLSLEEQFYVVFPIGLFLAHRYAKRSVAIVIGALTLASFIAAVWAMQERPEKAFYLLHFRVWELLIGAGVALLPELRASERVHQALAAAGAFAILLSVALYQPGTAFPGASALLPCLGTAVLIYANCHTGPISVLLANRVSRFVGLISYSVYLWHWPLIVFAQYQTGGELTPILTASVIVASLICGTLSWKYVEQPVRFGRVSALSWKILAPAGVAVILTAVGFGTFVSSRDGLPGRLPADARKLYEATFDFGTYFPPACFADSDGRGLQPAQILSGDLCTIGVPGKASFLLWGDSHAAAIAPGLSAAAKQLGVTGLFVGRGSCPPLPGTPFAEDTDVKRCIAHTEAIEALIKRERFPLVFLAAYWPKYVHRSELPGQGVFFSPDVAPDLSDWSQPIASGLMRVIKQLKGDGSQVALVMDVPEAGYRVPEALARAQMTGQSLEIAPPIAYTHARQSLARKVLLSASEETGALVVDPMEAMCDQNRCRVMDGDTVLYRDGDHLSGQGAAKLAPIFVEALEKLKQGD